MLIDNNSQVKLIDLISQTKITSIDDFPVDVEPNRIKEKKESLKNTLNNRFNVPMSKRYISNKKDDKVSYSVVDIDFDDIQDGAKKPINVKDFMLENIKKSNLSDISNATSIKEDKNEINTDSNNSKDSIVSDKKIKVDDKNLELLIAEVNKFKEKIDIKMQKIKSEKEEIETLNGVIKDLSLQYDEIKNNLEDAKTREMKLQEQLVSKLNDQIDSLNSELLDISKLSDEVSQKKDDSSNMVIEFKKKIKSTQDEIEKVNAEINKKEQLLASFNEKANTNKEVENDDFDYQIKKSA